MLHLQAEPMWRPTRQAPRIRWSVAEQVRKIRLDNIHTPQQVPHLWCKVQEYAQKKAMQVYGWTIDDFRREFYKNYIREDIE